MYRGERKIEDRKGVNTILKFKSTKKTFAAVLIIAVSLVLFLNFVSAEASSRSTDLDELMKNSLLEFRKVEVNGTIFDVYINQSEKSITVRGAVKDLDEEDTVRRYFMLRAPSDYQVQYDITILY